jgi:hypothetical protein
MSHGEHIRIVGGGRVVHAIDCGDRTALHLAEGDGGPATVKRSLLADLTQGTATVEVVRAAHKVYPPQMVVARAFSKLGDPAAGAMFPTSEHFAAWCVSGQAPRPSPRPAPPPPPGPPAPGALEAIRSAVEKVVGAAAAAERKVAKAVSRAGKKAARVERKIAARVAAPGRRSKGARAKARASGARKPAGGRKAPAAGRPAGASSRKGGKRRKR